MFCLFFWQFVLLICCLKVINFSVCSSWIKIQNKIIYFRYALLVGHPPFETATLKETYIRITENRYSIPDWVSSEARNLITKCLTNEPELRPSLDSILRDEFFTCGHYPNRLSPSCCTSPPRFQSTSAGSFVRATSRYVWNSPRSIQAEGTIKCIVCCFFLKV